MYFIFKRLTYKLWFFITKPYNVEQIYIYIYIYIYIAKLCILPAICSQFVWWCMSLHFISIFDTPLPTYRWLVIAISLAEGRNIHALSCQFTDFMSIVSKSSRRCWINYRSESGLSATILVALLQHVFSIKISIGISYYLIFLQCTLLAG